MKKSRLNLKTLSITSFVTAQNEKLKGGSEMTNDPMGCHLSLLACSGDVMCSATSDQIQ